MPYYPRVPIGCFLGSYAPSITAYEWGSSGVGGFFDPYTGKYLEDLAAASVVYGSYGAYVPTFQGPMLPRPTLQGSPPPSPYLQGSPPPTPTFTPNPSHGVHDPNPMLVGELMAIHDMARSVLDQVQGRRPAPWVEYQVQRARRRLEDVTLYVQYGSSRKGNPIPEGHMATQSLQAVVRDAGFLSQVIEPGVELPEWVAAYIHEAHIEVQSVYSAMEKHVPVRRR